MFSKECRLIDTHNSIQPVPSNTMCTTKFLPVKQPEWFFIESLLCVFHFSGMCCVIVGDFVTHMVGKFAHSLYVSVCCVHSPDEHVSVWHHSMKIMVKLVSKFVCWGISYWSTSFTYPVQISRVYCMSRWCICSVEDLLHWYLEPLLPTFHSQFHTFHLEFIRILFYGLCHNYGTVLYSR